MQVGIRVVLFNIIRNSKYHCYCFIHKLISPNKKFEINRFIMEDVNLSIVKWFSGGKERKDKASELIQDLMLDLKNSHNTKQLEQLLVSYKKELDEEKSSVPFILSRLNVSISKIISENNISLTKSQADILKKIRTLSHIRHGY